MFMQSIVRLNSELNTFPAPSSKLSRLAGAAVSNPRRNPMPYLDNSKSMTNFTANPCAMLKSF